jgi:uroporphyrinogen decarboxylase
MLGLTHRTASPGISVTVPEIPGVIMTHRERVFAAIDGRPTDRIPAHYYGSTEATQQYCTDLNLPNEAALIQFLDTDVLHVSPGRGSNTTFRREKEFARDIEDLDALRHLFEDVPSLDELIDNTPLLRAREQWPEHALLMGGPGSFFLGMCSAFGYETALMHHVLRPDIVELVVELGIEYAIGVIDKMHREVGNVVDILSFEDDFGTQTSLYISAEMFRRFYKPAFATVFAHAKQCGYRVQYHCCGAVAELIPDFIEMGSEMLDPIQVSADGMELEGLAKRFKGQICFHGGLDTQHLLPYGTPEEVEREVARVIELLGTTKAFIAPSQFFLPDIPTVNLLAMYRAKRTE